MKMSRLGASSLALAPVVALAVSGCSSIPASRGDHGEDKGSRSLGVQVARADIFGDMGEVELDGPAATRLEIDEQQPGRRAEHVAQVRLAVP